MNCHSNGCVQQSQLFTHLFKLLQALNFFVYHVPFVDKQIALWAQGLVHLTLIWHHGEHTFSGKELKAKFKNISLHPSKYTFSFFSHSNITYVRLPISFPQHQQMQPRHFKVDSKHIYIGSTKEGLPKREWNRISKYKQVTQEQLVHVEPAIRYWARNNTFYQHTVLVLSAHDTYQQAWCFEHLLIQRWQPHLNYPHILRHFRRKSNSFVRLAVQHRTVYSIPEYDSGESFANTRFAQLQCFNSTPWRDFKPGIFSTGWQRTPRDPLKRADTFAAGQFWMRKSMPSTGSQTSSNNPREANSKACSTKSCSFAT